MHQVKSSTQSTTAFENACRRFLLYVIIRLGEGLCCTCQPLSGITASLSFNLIKNDIN